MKQVLFSVLCCICCMAGSAQTNYYVDGTNGNDTYNGNASFPWKTIQKACNSATPNSVVFIKAGTYYENLVVNVTGTAGNPITFRNYMNDSVFIDGTGTAGTTMLQMTDMSYLIFRGLVVQNLTVNNAQGILAQTSAKGKSTGLSFSNITIRHINWTANPSTIPSASDNAQGLIVYGADSGLTNLTIDSCYVYDNILGFSEAISIDGNINGFSVTNCRVHDNTNIGIVAAGNYGTSGNPATDHARNGIISGNTCYKNVSNYATSGGVYIDGGWNIVVERNSSYGNGYGVEVGCEQNGTTDSIMVKNNLLFNNQEAGLAIGGYTNATTGQVLNSIVRNNTFFQNNYANDMTGEIAMTKASNCVFKNNIFYTNAQDVFMYVDTIKPQSNNIFSYNCWYSPSNDSAAIIVQWKGVTYNSFNAYRIGASEENGSSYENPALVNPVLPMPDLHLKSISQCINTGDPSTVVASGETDFDNNMRVNGIRIDKGAYEYITPSPVNEVNEPGFSIFPDPVSHSLFLQSPKRYNKIELLDISGRTVYSWQGEHSVVDVSGLTKGIYFVKLYFTNGYAAVHKFIKE